MRGSPWSAESFKNAYRAIVSAWTEAGVEPTQVGAVAPGVGPNYGSFKHKRHRIESLDFALVRSISLRTLTPACDERLHEWIAKASLSAPDGVADCGFLPAVIGPSSRRLDALGGELLRILSPEYAYLFRQRLGIHPELYAIGAGVADLIGIRHGEFSMNISWWGHTVPERPDTFRAGLLRDIYPRNFLSDPYLEAPIGRTAMTLREWIEDDPDSRGSLTPFTDTLTEWRPPLERIPEIREALYRAGRVFYWRFICREHAGSSERPRHLEPLFRPNLAEPWEAPDPIPEIYRASYYADKDPGLIY
jgi:hypothetical protein